MSTGVGNTYSDVILIKIARFVRIFRISWQKSHLLTARVLARLSRALLSKRQASFQFDDDGGRDKLVMGECRERFRIDIHGFL